MSLNDMVNWLLGGMTGFFNWVARFIGYVFSGIGTMEILFIGVGILAVLIWLSGDKFLDFFR